MFISIFNKFKIIDIVINIPLYLRITFMCRVFSHVGVGIANLREVSQSPRHLQMHECWGSVCGNDSSSAGSQELDCNFCDIVFIFVEGVIVCAQCTVLEVNSKLMLWPYLTVHNPVANLECRQMLKVRFSIQCFVYVVIYETNTFLNTRIRKP